MTEQAYTVAQPGVVPPAPNQRQAVNLVLDELERDDVNVGKEVFRIAVGNKFLEFLDPAELPYDVVLAAAENPFLLVERALDEENRKFWYSLRLPTWQAAKILKSYTEYYQLEDLAKNFV